jgi:1-acyl-sn-glycerol-3-phosphate acyltransferase
MMTTFAANYRSYVRNASSSETHFGFDLSSVAKAEPYLAALYKHWWKVCFQGAERLPKEGGPALIVGNSGGAVPWPALMLMYALMSSKANARRINLLMNLSWIEDQRLYSALTDIGFVPWSFDNAKSLFEAGELVAIFPEGAAGHTKPFSERYRLREFDWTQFMPAIELNVPIYSLATLGSDESIPILSNLEELAKLLGLPAYPVTPFFPWLPFPSNLISLPVPWTMHLLKPIPYQAGTNRDSLEDIACSYARFIEGEIQAELNRLLRGRTKIRK